MLMTATTAAALAVLSATGATAFAATPPSVAYQIKCSGCSALMAAGVSPDKQSIVFGGGAAFGLFDRTIANFTWTQNFVDFQSEQEGPFAFPTNNIFAGLSPDSGTEQSLWAINVTNGNLTWEQSDDGSLDEVALCAAPGSFISGAVSTEYIVKYDARTGKKMWKVNVEDIVFEVVAGSMSANKTHAALFDDDLEFGVAVTFGSTVAVYNVSTGFMIWQKTLPTQTVAVALADERDALYVAGGTDVDGNQLTYTTVYKFDWRTGAQLWAVNVSQADTGNQPLVSWLEARGGTVLGASLTNITSIDVATGDVRWSRPAYVPSSTSNVPTATLGLWNKTEVVYASVNGTDLTAIDTTTGTIAWTVAYPDNLIASMPAIFLFDQLITPITTQDGTHGFVVAYDLPNHKTTA
jgi:outer membrane protein assembly factor BamB